MRRPALTAGSLGTVSETGWTVAALGVGGWALGLGLGWTEAAVVAVGATVLLASACCFLAGRLGLVVTVEVEPSRVTVGQPVSGELRVESRRRASAAATLDLPIGDGGVTFQLSRMAPGRGHVESFVVPTARRGVISLGPARAVRGDPMGLISRDQLASQQLQVYVHPRVVSLEPFGLGLLRDLEGATREETSVSELAFHALRDYVPGDDRRHIAWRASARHGSLLVRQFLDTRRSHLAVVVDSDASGYPSEEEYESAISVAASLLRRALSDQYAVSFHAGEEAYVGSAAGPWWPALDACSRARPSEHGLTDLAARAGRRAPEVSIVVLVLGAGTESVAALRAAAAFPARVAVCVVRVDQSRPPSMGRIADLPELVVPAVEDLRSVLSATVP